MSDRFFRRALLATAAMNVGGFILLAPPVPFMRQLVGIPEPPPLFGWLVALWVLFFGLCYWRLAYAKTEERFFLIISIAGKATFALLLVAYWLAGELPLVAPLAGSPDLFFAALFAARLYAIRPAA